MIIKELNIPCIWSGTLTGILLRNEGIDEPTMKIVCIHGWLDNLNSLLPLAEKLMKHQPNYEIYLYDRAGHGFSSHIPKGMEYSNTFSLQEFRTVVKTLGWNKEKFTIIGHSYGAMIGMMYAASYPDEVLCFVAIDALLRGQVADDAYWHVVGLRIDSSFQSLQPSSKDYSKSLTFEKALEVTATTRPGITKEAARLLTERSVRYDSENRLYFTRDESLKMFSLAPFTETIARNATEMIKAPILFLGSKTPQWPKPQKTINLLMEQNPHFEMMIIDGSHHFHMTHVDEVVNRIEQYFKTHSVISMTRLKENSKL